MKYCKYCGVSFSDFTRLKSCCLNSPNHKHHFTSRNADKPKKWPTKILMPIFATTKVGVSMKLLKYSYCKICGKEIPYSGQGRPKEYCDDCRWVQEEQRRKKWTEYMRKYREKRRKMFLEWTLYSFCNYIIIHIYESCYHPAALVAAAPLRPSDQMLYVSDADLFNLWMLRF